MWFFDPNRYDKVNATRNLLYITTHHGSQTVISHDEDICMAQAYLLLEADPDVLRLRLRRLGSVGLFDFPPESWDTLMTRFSNSPYPKNIRADQRRALMFNPNNVERACEVDPTKYFFRFTDRWTYDDPWIWKSEWDFFCANMPSEKIVPSHEF